MKKITKKTNLAQLVKSHPQTAEVLIKDYGLFCVGCWAAPLETLEEGAKAHGLNESQINEMIKQLNKLIREPCQAKKK